MSTKNKVMNLKDILEKRNSERTAAQGIYKKAKDAKRNLTDKEARSMTDHYTKAKTFDDNLKALKAKRALDAKDKKIKETRGVEKMTKENRSKKRVNAEVRALGAYLRSGNTAQYRDAINSYSDNNTNASDTSAGLTVPHNVYGNVIKKASEDAPLFSAVRHIPAVNGTITLPRESNTTQTGFVGEGENLNEVKTSTDDVTLNQKRVGSFAQLTTELLQDSAINIVNYAVDRLSWSFGKALENSILNGNGNKEFTGINNDKGIKQLSFGANLTPANMLDMISAINPEYLRNAMFVVSRDAFDQITKMKDGNGQYLIFKNAGSDAPGTFKFRNIPIYVSDTLNANTGSQMVLGDFNQGYAVMGKQGMNLQHVTQDSRQALKGGHLIVLSGMMDGNVINPDALVTAKLGK